MSNSSAGNQRMSALAHSWWNTSKKHFGVGGTNHSKGCLWGRNPSSRSFWCGLRRSASLRRCLSLEGVYLMADLEADESECGQEYGPLSLSPRHELPRAKLARQAGNTLQHTTATHCNTPLQHTATHHCNTLQHTTTHCNALQHTATHCNTRRPSQKAACHSVLPLSVPYTLTAELFSVPYTLTIELISVPYTLTVELISVPYKLTAELIGMPYTLTIELTIETLC